MREFRFAVERGQVLAFLRAIGEGAIDNEVATGSAELPVPPPTFVQASTHADPDSPLRPNPASTWYGSGRTAGLADNPVRGVLHAEQHFEYRRPLQLGEVLTVLVREGPAYRKAGRRGGQLAFSEWITEFRDAAGALVVTARHVSVSTSSAYGPEAGR